MSVYASFSLSAYTCSTRDVLWDIAETGVNWAPDHAKPREITLTKHRKQSAKSSFFLLFLKLSSLTSPFFMKSWRAAATLKATQTQLNRFRSARAEGRRQLVFVAWWRQKIIRKSCCAVAAARRRGWRGVLEERNPLPASDAQTSFPFLLTRACCRGHVTNPHRPMSSLLLLHPHTQARTQAHAHCPTAASYAALA